MLHNGLHWKRIVGIVPLGLLLLVAQSEAAEATATLPEDSEGEGVMQRARSRPNPDFLFSAPKGSVAFRGGWAFARAEGEIFDFTRDLLTIDENDFDAPTLGLDVAFRINPRLDAVFGFEYNRASIRSEFRDFVDLNDLPIIQETWLSEVPLTASLKFYPISPGRQVSQYAWIPSAVVPYLGGGGGFMWYRFEQSGDFVDFVDLSIFTDTLVSDGWTHTAHVFGGVDFKLTPRLYLTSEVRYAWADAELGEAFVGFDAIDLAGLRTTAGIAWVF